METYQVPIIPSGTIQLLAGMKYRKRDEYIFNFLGGNLSSANNSQADDSSSEAKKEKPDPVMDKIIDSVQEEFDSALFSTKTEKKQAKTGWMSTKTVIRSRQMGRMFMSKRKKKENASDFRLFREKFTDENELSLNSLRVQKYMNNTRMKELARDNMPFMALEIHGLQDISLKQVRISG